MGVDVSHLVFVSSGDPNDQVVDDGLDRSESSHVFARAMVDLDCDLAFGGQREADGEM